MERTFKYLLLVCIALVMLNCKKDDPKPQPPSLEVSSEKIIDGKFRGVIGSAEYGKLPIHFEGIIPAGLQKLEIIKEFVADGQPSFTVVKSFDNSGIVETTIAYDYDYILVNADVIAGGVLKAKLTDNNNESVEVEIAEIEAYWTLDSNGGIYLDSDTEQGVENYNYYLFVDEIGSGLSGPSIEVQASGPVGIQSSGNFNEVHVIFDYDLTQKGGSPVGSYLCSPHEAATSNPALVDFFTVKNRTVLKIITYSSLTQSEKNTLNNLQNEDVLFLIDLFNKYQPTSTSERVTFNGAQGDVAFVLLKTVDGKIGVIKNYQLNEGVEATIVFGLWMMR
jgi:hypothetical protein